MAILEIGINPDVCDFCPEPTYSTWHLPQTDMHLCFDCNRRLVKSNGKQRGRWIETLRRLYEQMV
jgi:hypothetical protein